MGSNRILDMVDLDRVDQGDPRRGRNRRRVMLSAKLATSTGSYEVQIRDVSASGARVGGNSLPPVDAAVLMSRGTFRAYGRVVWVEGGVAGVEFDEPLDEALMMDALKGLPPSAAAPANAYRRPGLNRSAHPRFSDGRGWIDTPASRRG